MVVDVNAVRQARLGDKDSFAEVYQQIADDLYKVALYSLGNSHDAQDVVSETFIEAFKGIKNLRDDNSFKPWIMRILSIRCKRKIGQYISGRNEMDIDDFLDLQDERDGVEEQSTRKLALLNALDTLTAQERQIVALAVIQGYTVRETAEILGAPQGTVSSKLHRTLKKLRAQLEK
ncbi:MULTISPECIES: RNA polymerase sigma factor [Anaerotruncus]|jgi:RNA polymerase sigma factor (sigma-70 family)|uniref:RNA polymerase sigma factor n=1 Tax=Anaerotruncus TaxID=244127 RepID=UPI00083656A6|nr:MULTISPECIES: sigma-70 family RNA polymerase sigma factor [Anaerotruncus]RGX55761.1 sigma-70 family RNA polymerase sigma factor [Anaerotruncus sp. AF02-27]